MTFRGSNAEIEMSSPLINAIVNNALLFHPNSHINQMLPQIIHILHFSGRLAVPDFVTKYIDIEVKAVRWPEIWKVIRVSCNYCTLGL